MLSLVLFLVLPHVAAIKCTQQLHRKLRQLDSFLRDRNFTIKDENGAHDPVNGIEGSSTNKEASFLCHRAASAAASNASARGLAPFQACQTGFNRGRSAVALLMANPQLHLASFDLGEHAYVKHAHEWIDAQFPGRHALFLGNSAEEIRIRDYRRCSFVFVDGGHAEDIALEDIYQFSFRSEPRAPLLVDDCPDQGAVAAAFKRACEQRIILCQPAELDTPSWSDGLDGGLRSVRAGWSRARACHPARLPEPATLHASPFRKGPSWGLVPGSNVLAESRRLALTTARFPTLLCRLARATGRHSTLLCRLARTSWCDTGLCIRDGSSVPASTPAGPATPTRS